MTTNEAKALLDAAYADPLDVLAVLELARADAAALKNWEWADRLAASAEAVRELRDATREVLRGMGKPKTQTGEWIFDSRDLLRAAGALAKIGG